MCHVASCCLFRTKTWWWWHKPTVQVSTGEAESGVVLLVRTDEMSFSLAVVIASSDKCPRRPLALASARAHGRYNGMEGTHGSTMVVDKKEDCLVCGASQRTVQVDPSETLADLVDKL